jgi:hypothetical protein
MIDYQTIAELVNQISVDTWDVLRQIARRRPAMMLSELIDCKTRASQQPERQEPRSPTNEPIKSRGEDIKRTKSSNFSSSGESVSA